MYLNVLCCHCRCFTLDDSTSCGVSPMASTSLTSRWDGGHFSTLPLFHPHALRLRFACPFHNWASYMVFRFKSHSQNNWTEIIHTFIRHKDSNKKQTDRQRDIQYIQWYRGLQHIEYQQIMVQQAWCYWWSSIGSSTGPSFFHVSCSIYELIFCYIILLYKHMTLLRNERPFAVCFGSF